MPAPEFTLPTTGTAPKVTTRQGLETGINAVSQALFDQIGAISTGLKPAGNWDASGGSFPSGAERGTYYVVNVAGTVDGAAFAVGDWLIPLVDGPETGTYTGNWFRGDYSKVVPTKPDSAAAFEAGSDVSSGPGALWETKDGHRYEEVAAGGDLSNAAGVKLSVQKSTDGSYPFAAIGASADGVTDDTAKLQKLIDKASADGGGLITLPPGDFRIEGLEMKSGVKLRGAGFERNVASAGVTKGGTRFTRTSAVKMILAEGVGVRNTGNHAPISYCGLEGIMLDGAGYAADIMTMYACVTWTLRDVMFTACEGARWIDMREVWDTHFEFSRFEQGGSADGVFPGIEMISGTANGAAWERTNQIFFIACVFENFPGYSIRGTSSEAGYYTNEIYFTATKIESAKTDLTLPILSLRKMRTVVFNGLNLSARGQSGTAISAMLELNDTFGVHGTLQAEFITGGANWGAFAYGTSSGDVDLTVRAYGAYSPTSGFAVQHDGANANSYHVRCLAENGIVSRALSTPSTIGDVIQLCKRSGSPYFQFRDGAIADPWAMDIPADGAGTKWRLLHNGNPAVEVLNSNRLRALRGIQSDAPVQMPDYTVADLPDVSTWQRSWIYVLDEVGGPVMAFSDGTNWRRSTDKAIVS